MYPVAILRLSRLERLLLFWLLRRLGAGKFSDVFEAVDVGVNDVSEDVMEVDPASLCVIKVSDATIIRLAVITLLRSVHL